MRKEIQGIDMDKNLKAVIFARVSTREQENGYSIEAQINRIKIYCEHKKIPILKRFIVIESSTRGERTQFFEMIEFVKKQKFPIAIICDKVDRLQRSFNEYPLFVDLVNNRGVQLHFVTENEVICHNSNGHEYLKYQFGIMMAESYVKQLSDNVKRSMRAMPEKGEYPHFAPVGYINQRTDRHKTTIVEDPIMGPIVRKIFREYATGLYSLADITKMANKLGFKTVRKTQAHKQTIINLLNNPFYYGYMRCYNKLHRHKYECLITKKQFDACQMVLHQKSVQKNRKITDVYRGLIHCKNCGRLITPDFKTNRYKKQYTYLFCPHCKGTCINEHIADKQVQNDLCKLKKIPEKWLDKVLDKINEEIKQEHKLEIEQQRVLKSRLTQLLNKQDALIDMKIDNSITQEQYNKKLDVIMKEKEDIEEQLYNYSKIAFNGLNSLKDLIHLISQIPDIYKNSNYDEKRKILKLMYSNLFLEGKNCLFSIRKPLEILLSRGHRQVWSGL